MAYLLLVVCICAVPNTFSVKLPSTFQRCDWKQSDCLTEAIPKAISQLTKPMEEFNLPNMDPLSIPSLTLEAGTKTISLRQHLEDLKLFGISKITCTKIEFDATGKFLKMDCYIPKLTVDSQYDITGKVMILPVYGKGHGVLTFDELALQFTVKFEEYRKRSKTHFKVVEQKLALSPKLATVNLENLFDGNKALGDNINQVLNENSAAFFEDLKPAYEEALAKVLASVFNRLLAKVPIDELQKEF